MESARNSKQFGCFLFFGGFVTFPKSPAFTPRSPTKTETVSVISVSGREPPRHVGFPPPGHVGLGEVA